MKRIPEILKAFIPAERPRLALVLLAAILVLAAFLRVLYINWSLPNEYHTVTYNCDEGTIMVRLQGIDPAKLDLNPVSDDFPLALSEGTFHFYTYAATLKALSLAGLIKLVGSEEYYFSNIGEWAKLFVSGRLLSGAFGLLCVLLTYLLAKNYYGTRTALISAFFVAISPSSVIYSRYLIVNIPALFWILLSFIFYKRIIDTGSRRSYIFAGMATGLAIATRYSAGPLIAILLLAFIMASRGISDFKKIGTALLFVVLFFLIAEPYALLDYNSFISGVTAIKGVVAGSTGFDLAGNLAAVARSFIDSMGVIMFLAGIFGIALTLKEKKKDNVLILAWIGFLSVIFARAGEAATPGRILPVIPFMAIMAARSVDLLWNRKTLAGAGLLGAIIISASVFYGAYFHLLSKPDIRDVSSEWIIKNIPPKSAIGLVHEPSWTNPGVIDRKYRHPEHKHLPDYTFVSLVSGGWISGYGYGRLGETLPRYIIISDLELGQLSDTRTLERFQEEYGYTLKQRFDRDFSLGGYPVRSKIPSILYMPNTIYVLERPAPGGAEK